ASFLDAKTIQPLTGRAEELPFPNDRFDLVVCYTVLEHVRSLEQATQELVRVAKPGGKIFIECPNYLYPVEQHYKMNWVPWIPGFFRKAYLRLHGRPPAFLDTLNWVTSTSLRNLFRNLPVAASQVFSPLPAEQPFLFRLFHSRLGLEKNLYFILGKL
ncbi:MAG: class I SAM-dependent methyltransferase, partial [Candidatus Hydrogenedentota bacterium]